MGLSDCEGGKVQALVRRSAVLPDRFVLGAAYFFVDRGLILVKVLG